MPVLIGKNYDDWCAQTKEEIEQKTEDDRDTNISGASDNLHKNRNPPNISEV